MKIFNAYRFAFGILALTLVMFVSYRVTAMDVGELRSLDTNQRRATMRSIAVDQPENVGNEVLPVLEAGLSDPDFMVRRHAAEALVRIALTAKSAKAHAKPIITDITSYIPLRAALLKCVTDVDEEVRRWALGTMVFAFEPTQEFCDMLIQQFNKETSPKTRSGIVRSLTEANCNSNATKSVVISALQDADPEVRGWAAQGAAKLKPPEALPLLADGLRSSDAFVRNNSASALVAYADDAKSYAAELEKIALSESNEAVRATLQSVIEKMRGADDANQSGFSPQSDRQPTE